MEKEKRGANFTKTEIDLLIDIALKHKHIIENKRTDATTCKDKNDAWENISIEFNASSGNFPRTTKTIRSKYETIKKNIRKKCSLLKSEQTKTGGGQCSVALTTCEEKILALSANTMIGFESRFDKDHAEPGPSSFKYRTLHDDVENEPEASVAEENIEFLDDENYDLFQYLKTTESAQNNETTLTSPEKSARIVETNLKRKIAAVDSGQEKKTRKGSDTKFIFKNKRTKFSTDNSGILKENASLKKEILILQKKLLIQEMETKTEISKLSIENLKLDIEIKRLTLQKLEANVVGDDYD